MEDNKVYQEIDLIYQKIKNTAKTDLNGIFWEILTYNSKREDYYYGLFENIYSGNSGTLLFLIEYYNIYKKKETEKMIIESSNWIENYCNQNETINYGFYTGRAGVSYVFIKACIALNNDQYYKSSKDIIAPFFKTLTDDTKTYNFDLLTGISGTLMVLLHQLNYKHDEDTLKWVTTLTNILLKNFKFSKTGGLNWGRSKNSKDSLCGMSHGAAGISWVLYELGYFFSNQDIKAIAKQAYLYERSHYDKRKKNWPDFRDTIEDNPDIQEILQSKKAINQPKNKVFFSAWCHGAPGIGLTRLRMHELTGETNFLDESKAALSTTIALSKKKTFSNYSLCHGVGGNSFLISQFNKFHPDAKLQSIVDKSVLSAIRQKEVYGQYYSSLNKKTKLEDNSLFNGYVGVGYFMLFSNSTTTQNPDILCPAIQVIKQPDINLFKPVNIKEAAYKSIYPITIHVIKHLDPGTYKSLISQYLDLGDIRLKTIIKENIKNQIKESSHYIFFNDAFIYENIKLRFDESSPGDSNIHLDKYYNANYNRSEQQEDKVHFQLNPHCRIKHTKWPWLSIIKNDKSDLNHFLQQKGTYPILIQRFPGGIGEFQLTELNHLIISCLKSPKSFIQLIDDIEKYIPIDDHITLIKKQLDILVNADFLIKI